MCKKRGVAPLPQGPGLVPAAARCPPSDWMSRRPPSRRALQGLTTEQLVFGQSSRNATGPGPLEWCIAGASLPGLGFRV